MTLFGTCVMNLKQHDAVEVVDVWDGNLRSNEVQQLHVMVRKVLDDNYTKPDPFLSVPLDDDKEER